MLQLVAFVSIIPATNKKVVNVNLDTNNILLCYSK